MTILRRLIEQVLIPLFLTMPLLAQSATTIFSGSPAVKTSEGGVGRTPEALTRSQASNLGCLISQIGNAFYWATRENTMMLRFESGAYITFVAADGSGYVRVVKPDTKKVAALVDEAAAEFDYVEHLLIGLRSVTYYGRAN